MIKELNQSYLSKNLESLYGKIVVLEETSSTNISIKESNYYQDKTILFAKNQLAGKGTNKRTFYTEKNKGIYASCVINCDTINHPSSFIPIIMGCALGQTLEFFNFDPSLKWVNDVLVNQKKVAGILCEKSASDSRVVVGVGLNVYTMNLPKDISLLATSLEDNTDKTLDINDIAVHLFRRFNELLTWNSTTVISLYHKYYQDMNKQIELIYSDVHTVGRIVGVDDSGALLVDIQEQRISVISTEQILKIRNNVNQP